MVLPFETIVLYAVLTPKTVDGTTVIDGLTLTTVLITVLPPETTVAVATTVLATVL